MTLPLYVIIPLLGLWSYLGLYWLATLNDLHMRRSGNACWWPRWWQTLFAGPLSWVIILIGTRYCDEPVRPGQFEQAKPAPRFTHKPALPEPRIRIQLRR